MGIRTGQQYLDKLNSMNPHVVINGEVVSAKVADHPVFRNNARTCAKLFDMQHDPKYQDALTYTSPTTGDLVKASFLVPRAIEDLEKRRQAISTWAEFSNGFLGRSGDYMNSALTALSTAKKFFAQADPVFGERIEAYYACSSWRSMPRSPGSPGASRFFGDPVRMAGALVNSYDPGPARARIREFLSRQD
jgi:4-hydroxyphenylacetate 3-monooxygenase